MNIVLHQPEIPHNTGAIGRTCLVTGSALHLIRPYGFFLDEKSLKRSGLDYWHKLGVREYDDFAAFEKNHPRRRFFFVETSGGQFYSEIKYEPNDFFIFGSETCGLPQKILDEFPAQIIRIPMLSSSDFEVKKAVLIHEGAESFDFEAKKTARHQKNVDARSLNLSVAVGIVLYEALRQTGFASLI